MELIHLLFRVRGPGEQHDWGRRQIRGHSLQQMAKLPAYSLIVLDHQHRLDSNGQVGDRAKLLERRTPDFLVEERRIVFGSHVALLGVVRFDRSRLCRILVGVREISPR
jgi:hypothetical protein